MSVIVRFECFYFKCTHAHAREGGQASQQLHDSSNNDMLGGTMLFLISFLVAEESLRFSPPKFGL